MLTCDWYNVQESSHSLRADVTEPVLSDEQFCEIKGHLTCAWPLHLSTAISILRRDQPDWNHDHSKSIALRNTGKENVKGEIWKHFVIWAYHVAKHYCNWITVRQTAQAQAMGLPDRTNNSIWLWSSNHHAIANIR